MQRPPWKFSDRIQPSSEQSRRRHWANYAAYFHDAEIACYVPAHRFFTDDVFHDSPCDIGAFNPKTATLTMTLENHRAIANAVASSKRRHKFRDQDFRTHITFHGVTELRQPRPISFRAHDDYYSHCELGRSRGSNTLLILTRGMRDIGWLFIRFERFDVEDIRKQIAKYFPRGRVRPSDLLIAGEAFGWLNASPER